MFTGLIKNRGVVKDIVRIRGQKSMGAHKNDIAGQITETDSVRKIGVAIPRQHLVQQPKVGDSVSVNGVCLTVREGHEDVFVFDISQVTADATTINVWDVGQFVNIEMPLTPSDPIGGHIVQGHVDGVGMIEQIIDNCLRIKIPDSLSLLVVKSGSIAVDGVSLTVVNVSEQLPSTANVSGNHGKQNCANSWFEINLIPETLERTTLGGLQVGQFVNLETDVLARHVRRFMSLVNSFS
ncbi:riboflavin synthase [Tropheryma whipplei]|uniref:Riboflavin synthase n=1 Tax=Tropheryma whipplei (strain Twist) TaxID=203267 RepID=Q83FM9_TROWT|nr:riboflavin synthase [Tropheryma whipplei]AAO44785.1 riboflavin synthase alpha chain [Tropheryma whipplei str. Twist]MCO8190341.1 riboflavin synthase [Tropheryma whipplei]